MNPHLEIFWQELKMWASDEELFAIAACYALITFSDGAVTVDEVRHLRSFFPDDEKGVKVRAEFVRLVNAMRENFKKGRKLALANLAALPGEQAVRQRVFQTAQAAVVADGGIAEAEEVVLRDIAERLGVKDESPE